MRRIALRIGLGFAIALIVSRPATAGDAQPLVQGTDPSQFVLVGIGPEAITISEDGVVSLPGKPSGYFATKKSYKNYVLEFEWMYERPDGLRDDAKFNGNSGLLVHVVEPHKVWPKCVEVQLGYRDAGHTFAINGAKYAGKKDAQAQEKARKPVGQWNREEVTCRDGEIICKLNGIEVDRGQGSMPDAGQIGWQSEGAPIRFRNLRIKVLD